MQFIDAIIYYTNFGGGECLEVFFSLFLIYFLVKAFNIIKNKKNISEMAPILKNFFKLAFLSFLFFLIFGFTISQMSLFVSKEKISFISNFFTQIDKNIFGFYPQFWFQNITNPIKFLFDLFTWQIFFVYEYLATLSSIIFVFLIALDVKLFYKAAIAFALTILISTPLWFFFPAITPYDAYINNILHAPVPASVQTALTSYSPNQALLDIFKLFKDADSKSSGFLPITTMPSMHIAWSVLVVFFGIKLWKKSAYFLIPYFFINMIATLFLLQHYTIDLFVGFLVAILSIYLAGLTAKKIKIPEFIVELSKEVQKDFMIDELKKLVSAKK
jgi:hypothetical protein